MKLTNSHITSNRIETGNFRSLETWTLRFIFIFIITITLPFTCSLRLSAQNLGISTPGTTNYPQTIVGNTSNGNGNDGGNYCIANYITTTVPLTAIAIKTFGTAGGNVKLAIYTDNSGSPGTKIYGETEFTVTANVPTISTITNTYLPSGTYWLVYNMNSSSTSANFITKNTVSNYARKSITQNYSAAFPGTNATWNPLANTFQDNIALVGVAVEGYAKATKAVLPANGTFGSISFYSHAAGNARLAIYNDAGGAPSSKQWESNNITINASAWNTVNISSGTPSSLNLTAGNYWLAWQWNSAASGPSYSVGAANTGNAIVQSYGAFPASWAGGTASTENWSIYATYSPCTPPPAPAVTSPVNCCLNGTASPLTANGTNLIWYTTPTGGTGSQTTPTPSTTSTGTTSYYVSQNMGCEGPRAQIDVIVHSLPVSSVTGKTNITCYAANDGMITIKGSAGTGPYKFSVENGVWTDNAYPVSYTFNGLKPGEAYTIKVKDSYGCESISIP
jgi:hypothetical protein